MPRRPALLALALLIGTAPALADDGDDWPGWRGPDGDGTTAAAGLPTEWGPEKNVRWRLPLPEAGNSTPVVWGGRAFLTQPVSGGNRRELWCVDRATGGPLWRRRSDRGHRSELSGETDDAAFPTGVAVP